MAAENYSFNTIVPATATDLLTLAKSARPTRFPGQMYSFYQVSLRVSASAGATALVYFGDGSTMTNTPNAVAGGFLAAGESTALLGQSGGLSSIFVVSALGTEVLFVDFIQS